MFGLGKEPNHYKLADTIHYYSFRYHKWITVPKGYESDGATGALDVCPKAWFTHDWICGNWSGHGPMPYLGKFDDGTECNNWQASHIISDILKEEGFWFRRFTWFWATWLIGGGAARDNGMF